MENQEEPLFTTNRSIKRARLMFKIMSLIIPPGIGLFMYLENTDNDRLFSALFCMCFSFLVILVTGYTTAIGLRIYTDRLEIITPFSENTYQWEQVRAPGFWDNMNPGRFDIHIKGVFLPYIYAYTPWCKRDKAAIPLIIERISKRRD
jgi:hypothetical protein